MLEWVAISFSNTCMHAQSLQCVHLNHPAAAKSLQSYLTLGDPIDGSLPGSSVHGIFQARVLEWIAIAFSKHPCEEDATVVSV